MSIQKVSKVLIVISGPSGVGKSTIAVNLMRDCRDVLCKIVTYTTRTPRKNELDKIDYNFITKMQFETLINENFFAEHNLFGDNIYGISMQSVTQATRHNKIYLTVIDNNGYYNILRFADPKKIIGIFLLPPSLKELQERLFKRQDDNVIVADRQNIIAQLKYLDLYNYIIVNDQQDITQNIIKQIIATAQYMIGMCDVTELTANLINLK